jgi:hypothetical protein
MERTRDHQIDRANECAEDAERDPAVTGNRRRARYDARGARARGHHERGCGDTKRAASCELKGHLSIPDTANACPICGVRSMAIVWPRKKVIGPCA